MNRSTIDFGIDLGTTNSAIAVLNGIEPEIFKNSDDQDVTPSAVFINKQGVLRVGTRAKAATAGERSQGDAYTEFKRQMGTPHEYEFASSGQRKKPEELSAEVLKELRTSAEVKTGEIIQSAVITVPAAFGLHQCDATRRAAALAGFMGSPLLTEPVAAALAYGFQIDSEKAYWMVYDFGGGTFDAALIKAEEGMINVVHHGGDNFLGGSDIDWAIIEKIIIPHLLKNFDLPDFARGSVRWEGELKRIKFAVEAAKIELSTKELTTLSGAVTFEDDSGEMIDCDEISLSRNDLIRVAQPLISRSIEISQEVLKAKNLGLHAVQRVIVVGGPTKAPYFREILSTKLGIPIDFSQDPLTVVARGASVFASTQTIDSSLQKRATVGEFQVKVSENYKPVGHESDPLISAKVTSPNGTVLTGFTIEFVNRDTKWRSGQIPLDGEGAFMTTLLAEKGSRNTFHIELSNGQGTLQKAVPDHVVYTIGAVTEKETLFKSIGLRLARNKVERFFNAGMTLPAKKLGDNIYKTTVELKAGQAGEPIRIPIVEGEHDRADRNHMVGYLEIDPSMVRRDLPVGTDVEIELKIENRKITLKAIIPFLDEEFTKTITIEKASADAESIAATLRKEKQRLNELKEKAENAGDDSILEELRRLESDENRDRAVQGAKDPSAAEKAEALVLEMQNKLDSVEQKLAWPALVAEARELQDNLKQLADDHGTSDHKEQADKWSEEVNSVVVNKQVERLTRKIKEGHSIRANILTSLPAFWVGNFQRMERDRSNFSNPDAAERLFERGRQYLQENNINGLSDVVRKLWNLMPDDESEATQTAIDFSTIQ